MSLEFESEMQFEMGTHKYDDNLQLNGSKCNGALRTPTLPSPPPTPPTQTLTDKSWRPYISWTKEFEQGLLKDIESLEPEVKPNLLMMGPVGQGKSSFINAIISIGKGRKYAMAMVDDTRDSRSCTSDYDSYTHADLLKGYNLMDSMGFEPNDKSGFHPDDIVFLLKGHVKRGYTFHPVNPISKENKYYNDDPTLTDQCHRVIFVVSAKTMHADINPVYAEKIRQLQKAIRREHVPRVLVLTNVDQLCDEVEEDITNLFRSVKVKKAVKVASELFGIELASIHPVKNYEVDYNIEPKTNIPLLLVLRQTMQYGADRVEYVLSKESKQD